MPPIEILEALFRKQLERTESLRSMMALYTQDVTLNGKPRDYDRLVSMVRTHLEEKRRQKNREELSTKNQGRAVPAGADTGNIKQGDCRNWINVGSCQRGDNCPWKHDAKKKGERKGRPRSGSPGKGKPKGGGRQQTPPPKKTPRGKSPKGNADRPPCTFYKQGKCTKGEDCDFWHVPVCKFFKSGKCNVPKCAFLHSNPAQPASTGTPPASPRTGGNAEPDKEGSPEVKRGRSKSRNRNKKKTGSASVAQLIAMTLPVLSQSLFLPKGNLGVPEETLGAKWYNPSPKVYQALMAKSHFGSSQTTQVTFDPVFDKLASIRDRNPSRHRLSGSFSVLKPQKVIPPDPSPENHKESEKTAVFKALKFWKYMDKSRTGSFEDLMKTFTVQGNLEPRTIKPAIYTKDNTGKWLKTGVMLSTEHSRMFIVDSGASFHLISWANLSKAEKRNVRRMETPIVLSTANGTLATQEVELVLTRSGGFKSRGDCSE